jgi:hypothetical protein
VNGLFPQGEAVFSSDGVYRYWLTREPTVSANHAVIMPITCAFVMLNPSTADADHDDNTIRKCKKYTRLWGFHRTVIVNVFGFRSTDPKKMWWAWSQGWKDHGRIVGPDNDHYITKAVQEARLSGGRVVAAWGSGAGAGKKLERAYFRERCAAVCKLIGGELTCLKENNDGTPAHPLYQPDDAEPMRWRGAQ